MRRKKLSEILEPLDNESIPYQTAEEPESSNSYPFASALKSAPATERELQVQSLRMRVETSRVLADLARSVTSPDQTHETLNDTINAIASLRTLLAVINATQSNSSIEPTTDQEDE